MCLLVTLRDLRGTLTQPVVTFRFSEGLSSAWEPLPDAAPQPVYQQTGLSRACASSLAGVPTCAG